MVSTSKFDLLRKKGEGKVFVLLCDGYTEPRIRDAINDMAVPNELLHVRYHGSPDSVERCDVWMTRRE